VLSCEVHIFKHFFLFTDLRRFPIYLSLQVGTTLAFAVDTTGSMAGEIQATKDQTINIINSTRNTADQPLVYVLSPFNDPG